MYPYWTDFCITIGVPEGMLPIRTLFELQQGIALYKTDCRVSEGMLPIRTLFEVQNSTIPYKSDCSVPEGCLFLLVSAFQITYEHSRSLIGVQEGLWVF